LRARAGTINFSRLRAGIPPKLAGLIRSIDNIDTVEDNKQE